MNLNSCTSIRFSKAESETAGKRGEVPHKTRRKPIPGGSVAASMLLTVLLGNSPLLPATVIWIYAQLF
jgi:hypothetical protein